MDNGANYRSHHLALVCAKLGIALIHARPHQPAGKGKIERWFRTLRAGWLRHLDMGSVESLADLNRALAGWIEGEYHQAPHRGLGGQTPLDRWAQCAGEVRYPDECGLDLNDLFLFENAQTYCLQSLINVSSKRIESPVCAGLSSAGPARHATCVWH